MDDFAMQERLRRMDYLLLAAFCLLLFGFALVNGRPLSGHEAIQPETAREMLADHDWIIPKYGGRPWLERPPLPQWLMVAVAGIVGRCDAEWIVRIPPVILATGVVLVVAGLAAGWYGRAVGLLSGLILATMLEFYRYSSNPEADIFLCAIVTAAMALFVYLEFRHQADDRGESVGFLGRRPLPVLAFFVLWGMTNLAKGLVFGTTMVLVPMAGYLLLKGDLRSIRRYVWLWGWLAFAVVGGAWPLAAYLRYPDVVDLWFADYVGRLNHGYMAQPAWYYLAMVPYVLLPWTPLAFLGLGLAARRALRGRQTPERFLWVWAVVTPLLFSIPDGKHHHYLLQCIAPWSVLAALGVKRLWQDIGHWPGRLLNPGLSLLGLVVLGLPGAIALWFIRSQVPGPVWVLPALLVAWPLCVVGFCWALSQRNGRVALATSFALLAAAYCVTDRYHTEYIDRNREDTAFLRALPRQMALQEPLLVVFDAAQPLEASRLLFYGPQGAGLLHNLTFLLDDRIAANEVYLIARAGEADELRRFGSPEMVLQSRYTKNERSPADRWTLFRLRYRADLARKPGSIRISPMQAASRAPGPLLE
jgi:4-amino-4-deoxy-L-arabinose transferase-like glycosyltransferase